MRKFLVLPFVLFGLNACSVMMAATSQDAPNTSGLQAGAQRADIEKVLGRPTKQVREWTGVRATYQYMTNDQKNYKRAATYAVLDGLTLGAAELFTFGMEAVQGDRHEIEIFYDRSGRLISKKETVFKAPIDKPEKIFGIDEDAPETATKPQLPVKS